MWTSICYLGVEDDVENALGEKFEQVTYGDYVFCDKKSIRMAEFYQAAVTDFKPTLTLVLKQVDYEAQRYVMFEGDVFTVIRTYEPDKEDIELILERGIKHGDAAVSNESGS